MSNETNAPRSSRRGKRKPVWDAKNIRALRDHLGMTQTEMAEELQVRQQTISEWETGIHTPHRSTQKMLSMVAERVGFGYQVNPQASSELVNPEDSSEQK